MKARFPLVGGVAVVVAVAGAALWWPALRLPFFGPPSPAAQVVLTGNVEAHESILSFSNVQGIITSLRVDEGAQVASGTVLATVDDRVYRQQLRIDLAVVHRTSSVPTA